MTLIVEEVSGVAVLPSVDLVALNEGFGETFESFLYGARVIHFFVFFVVHNSLLSTPVFWGPTTIGAKIPQSRVRRMKALTLVFFS